MMAPAQNQLSGSLSVESTPPFSVLMSLYAREQPEYLRQCLASLAAILRYSLICSSSAGVKMLLRKSGWCQPK